MSPPARRPDLFLVGAPKCGTTAVYRYLQRHRDVFMAVPKEPQFFAEDILGQQRNITSLRAYMDCFAGANGEKHIGEASSAYLGSPQAASEIKAFSPGARIIIMLRNPVDVMYAQHSERLFSQMEHLLDFEAAVDSHEERRWGAGPFAGQKIRRLSYRQLSRYAEPVARYLGAFGRENVHVILYDDFRSNVTAVFAQLLCFLDLPPAGETEDNVVNGNRRARNAALHRLVLHPPKVVRSVFRGVFPRRLRAAMGRAVNNLNVVYAPRPPLHPQMRARLQTDCRRDVEALSRLLDRDLSHWCGDRG